MKSAASKTLSLLLCFGFVLPAGAVSQGTLSLDSYLSQVDGDNRDVKAAREASLGAAQRTSEATLIYSPQLDADAHWLADHKTNSLFPTLYEQLKSEAYSLGISQQTNFGLSARLAYDLDSYHYIGNALNPNKFWEGTPKIELSLSLLRNVLGSEVRAQYELAEAGALSSQYAQSFQAKATRAEAEGAYIRLAAARNLEEIYGNSMKRSQEILDWANRRMKLNLGENSDVYQAQASLESFRLQYQGAVDEGRTTSREFNRLRNIDSDTVREQLSLPDVTSLQTPGRAQFRDDVRAAIEGTRVADANATLGRERNKPTLEVYGSFAMNARQAEANKTISESFNDQLGPTNVVGVRLQTPLLIGAQANAREGYGREKVAAETLKDQKVFNQESDWKQLVLKLDEAKKRYEIATKLVEIQKKKADTERNRLRSGRTTTYQTLLFDQDLNLSQTVQIRAQSEILQIVAQMKTYQ